MVFRVVFLTAINDWVTLIKDLTKEKGEKSNAQM